MKYKINRLGGSHFLAPARDKNVFTLPDEARILRDFYVTDIEFRYARSPAAEIVVDPFCGIGHLALALPRKIQTVAADISAPALAFARFNRLLNRRFRCRLIRTDSTRPQLWESLPRTSTVTVLANPPFGPAPPGVSLPVHTAAGLVGGDVTVALLEALRRSHLTYRAAVLGVALTGGTNNSLVAMCSRTAARSETVTWLPLDGSPFWRLDDEHLLISPSQILLAAGAFAREAPATASAWHSWGQKMTAFGYDAIEYGLLLVNWETPIR